MQSPVSLKLILFVILGALFIWVALFHRLGSLLGAIIDPGSMVEGTPPSAGNVGTATESTSPGTGYNPANDTTKGTLNPVQIATYAVNGGLSKTSTVALATAIAIAESSGNTQAISPAGDYGLWQINFPAHKNLGYTQKQLLNPGFNALAMFKVSNGGTNWHPWVTFESGAYRQFMSQATQAAQAVTLLIPQG